MPGFAADTDVVKPVNPRSPRVRLRLLTVAASLALFSNMIMGLSAGAAPTAAAAGGTARIGLISDSAKPAVRAVSSTRSVNLGVRFRSSQDGQVTALQFYRSSKQKKAYRGSLWSASGRLLGQVIFKKSDKAGWQTAEFVKPISIKKANTYVASYLAPDGRFAVTRNAFTKSQTNASLTVLKNGGVHKYGRKSALPTRRTRASNYHIDVIFTPKVPMSTPAEPGPASTPVEPTPSSPTESSANPTSTPTTEPTGTPTTEPTTLPQDALAASLNARVLLGHQSVGRRMIEQLPAAFADAGLPAPSILAARAARGGVTPVFAETSVGKNGDPLGKMADFVAIMSSAVADNYDVALMKLCYVDFNTSTDAEALFNAYVATMNAVEQANPDVTFLYTTAPVRVESNWTAAPAATVDGLTEPIQATNSNHQRERYNALVRARYANTGRLFDIAAIEARIAGDLVATRVLNGHRYFVLSQENNDDGGHPNVAGSKLLATELMRLVGSVLD